MRAVLQRVTRGRVTVEGRLVGQIGAGLVVFVAVGARDTEIEADMLANKIASLRIFADMDSKFNLSVLDVGGEILVISQFTLYADSRKGRRPSFTDAARPEAAAALIESFVARMRTMGVPVATGEFQTDMLVEIHNSGPVTIWLDTDELPKKDRGGQVT